MPKEKKMLREMRMLEGEEDDDPSKLGWLHMQEYDMGNKILSTTKGTKTKKKMMMKR